MRFVTKRMVLVVNAAVIGLTGGTRATKTNLRVGQSLGFIDRIHQNMVFGESIYPDIFHQAAAYMFYVIKNHSFHDGNKRTGFAAAITFLQWNNLKFSPLDEDHVFDFVVNVAGGGGNPEEMVPKIATWLKSLTVSDQATVNL